MNNSRNLRIKNEKLLGYDFYMNWNIYGDFQICIRVSLSKRDKICEICYNFAFWKIETIVDAKCQKQLPRGVLKIFIGIKLNRFL